MKRLLVFTALLAPTIGIAAEVGGTWQGEYTCNQGQTGLTLTVMPSEANAAKAVFRFYQIKNNPGVPDGCFAMSGTVAGSQIQLQATSWLYHPQGYVTVDLAGSISQAGTSMTGSIFGPNCTTFSLERVTGDSDPEVCRLESTPVS